ncbi:MAG TPA: hypothetical protein VGQ44_18160 [Gemmatimonadaceae bacterium]|nr:hypothetical protein [Gemmatimonadaceae bacterium]
MSKDAPWWPTVKQFWAAVCVSADDARRVAGKQSIGIDVCTASVPSSEAASRFSAVVGQNPGLDPQRLVAGQIWVPGPNDPKADQYATPSQRAGLARELVARLALLPGMEQTAIGTSTAVPLLSVVNNPLAFSLPDEVSTCLGHP